MTDRLYAAAPPLDASAMEQARQRWAGRAKPPSALGRIEDLGVHLAGVTGRCPPPVPRRPRIVVFAGDHGVVAEGASAWPAEVTGAMISTMTLGGAAVNAFADVISARVDVVDVGVAGPRGLWPGVRDERVRDGSGNIARVDGMSTDEARAAVGVGSMLALECLADGADTLIGGDMGIGNTTASAALIAAIMGVSERDVTGAGAGVPDGGMKHKRALVGAALRRTRAVDEPLQRLAALGGLEIAALAGFYVTAAAQRVPFIVDGVISCAALCVAQGLSPGTAAHAIAGHRSSEPASTLALRHLGLDPLLDLQLRLGEGSGAALAFPLVKAAARALERMAALPEPT